MQVHKFTLSWRNNHIFSPFTMPCLTLAILLLLLPSAAFASALSTPFVGSQRNVDQAGVSVVRLVVTYTLPSIGGTPSTSKTPTVPPTYPAPTMECTGLGVLVSSVVANNGGQHNVWVLTDSSLVNPNKMMCSTANTTVSGNVQLSQIQVLASNEYTGGASAALTIGTLPVKAGDVTCGTAACEQGLAIFGFSSPHLQPYIDLAQSTPANTAQEQGIGLVNPASPVPANVSQASQYLTPQSVALASALPEVGMPIVDSNGVLVGMQLSSGSTQITQATMTNLMNEAGAQIHPANAVHDNWDRGINAYYGTHNYAAAQSAFQAAVAANPQFKAATTFKNLAAVRSIGNAGNASPTSANTLSGLPPLWVGSVVVLILLIVILLVVSMFIRRRRAEQHALEKFKEDEAVAHRMADLEARRIAESAPISVQRSPMRELPCPQCGHPVPFGRKNCPNCNAWLSSTDSGLHLRVNRSLDTSIVPPLTSQVPYAPQTPPVRDLPCPRCGNLVRAGAKYCSSCSVQLSRTTSGKLVALPEPERVPVKDVANNTTVQARLRDLWDKAGDR